MSGLSSRGGIPEFDRTHDGECMSILSHRQGVGLMFIALAGLISTVAVAIFLLLVLKNYIRNVVNPPPGKWKLIRTHVDAYLLSLLVADLLQGIGAVLSLKWSLEQKTYCSAYCTAQGVIQHLGETGVALGTLIIGLHTFLTVFFHIKPPQWAWIVVIVGQWSFLGLYIVVAYFKTKGPTPYYAPTPFCGFSYFDGGGISLTIQSLGCWISSEHDPDRVFAEYLWMWLAAFSNIALYIPLFFLLRGNIHVNPVTRKITFNFNLRNSFGGCFGRRKGGGQEWDIMGGGAARGGHGTASASSTASNGNEKEALKLIWYPLSYTAVILPISIARWSTSFMEPDTNTPVNQLPIAKTAVTTFIFGLSGLVNVLVFMLTRPHLLLFGPRRGMVGEPPRRLPSDNGPSSHLSHAGTTLGTSRRSEWTAKSPSLTQFEPPKYKASLPASPNPAAKWGTSIREARSTEMGFSGKGSSGGYEYPPPGFGTRRASRESDDVYDDSGTTSTDKGGSFLNLQVQSIGERGDRKLTGAQETFKPESDANAEGFGSSWVTARHRSSERFGVGEKLVVGRDVVLEESSDRDHHPGTPVWHGSARPV